MHEDQDDKILSSCRQDDSILLPLRTTFFLLQLPPARIPPWDQDDARMMIVSNTKDANRKTTPFCEQDDARMMAFLKNVVLTPAAG